MARFDSHQRFDQHVRYDAGGAPGFVIKIHSTKYMARLKLELKGKTVADKLSLGAVHITAMTGNTTYPAANRAPPDAQVQAAQDELATADAEADAAENAWKQKIQVRDAKEAVWDQVFTARANFCEAVTPNDPVALSSTGFPLRSAAAPVGDLTAPQDLRAKATENEGRIDLRCKTVTGASTYEWQKRLHTTGTPWADQETTTNASLVVTGLTPGEMYAFRVRAIGSAGAGPWSDEAVKRAP